MNANTTSNAKVSWDDIMDKCDKVITYNGLEVVDLSGADLPRPTDGAKRSRLAVAFTRRLCKLHPEKLVSAKEFGEAINTRVTFTSEDITRRNSLFTRCNVYYIKFPGLKKQAYMKLDDNLLEDVRGYSFSSLKRKPSKRGRAVEPEVEIEDAPSESNELEVKAPDGAPDLLCTSKELLELVRSEILRAINHQINSQDGAFVLFSNSMNRTVRATIQEELSKLEAAPAHLGNDSDEGPVGIRSTDRLIPVILAIGGITLLGAMIIISIVLAKVM